MLSVTSSVHFGPDEEENRRSVASMCINLLPSWRDFSIQDVSMHKISGGISNLIMKVAPSAGLVAPVVFKVFGDKTELLVDRDKELMNLIHLNAAGFGAQARYVRNHNDWRSWVSLSQLHSSHASLPPGSGAWNICQRED